jgi:hypothetical protein
MLPWLACFPLLAGLRGTPMFVTSLITVLVSGVGSYVLSCQLGRLWSLRSDNPQPSSL